MEEVSDSWNDMRREFRDLALEEPTERNARNEKKKATN